MVWEVFEVLSVSLTSSIVRLQNVNATDKLNKQCNRTECNVTVFIENVGRCICVCVYVCVSQLHCIQLITPHAQRERGKVIDRGVHIYIYIYVCGRKKNLNRTLEIDSPFQTLTVGLLVEFID